MIVPFWSWQLRDILLLRSWNMLIACFGTRFPRSSQRIGSLTVLCIRSLLFVPRSMCCLRPGLALLRLCILVTKARTFPKGPVRGSLKGGGKGKGDKGSKQRRKKWATTFNNKTLCLRFNSRSGCSDKNCQYLHQCCVVDQNNNKVCGGKHPAFEHGAGGS